MIDGTNLPYARTKISPEKSKIQINELLKKFGVRGIQWTWMDNIEILRFIHEFEMEGVKHNIAYEIRVPEIGIKKGSGYDRRLVRNDSQGYRVLWHVLKNRFVAIECGLKTFENEFLSDIIYKLPDGRPAKVGDIVFKQLSETKPIKLLES